ncbi:MAG TPA: sigma-70 family RNA polymerase sigma factor [Candidatus Tectomicrobia bacterium]|nr:sigma-70 family RNA polymerase sigma factor [Candidatus Tectomicrobia bacterium]
MAATHPALEDTQVQAAIAAGDYKRALELVAYTYLDLVFGYCFRVLNGDTSRAKDVTQQVFEEVCRGLARYRAESSVKTWLLAIAHHQCLKEISTCERRRRILGQHQGDVVAHLHADPPVAAESAVRSQEWLAWLTRAIDQLDPEDRSILIMRFGVGVPHELSAAEIAQILGISRAAAYRRLQEALVHLKRMMPDDAG